MEAKQTVDSGFDFAVMQDELFLPDGKRSGWFANRRVDNDEVLGVCSERYGIVQHSDLMERAEKAFARKGLNNYTRKVYVTDGGAKLRVNYDFKDNTIEVPVVGDKMGFRLTLQNSYDRTLRIAFMLGMLRLVCQNGMQTLEKELNIVKKHHKNLDINSIITDGAIDKALARFTSAADVFALIAGSGITQEQGVTALGNLADGNVISDKVREGISVVWNNPREDGADGQVGDNRNLYQLYNAVTQYLTSSNLTDKEGNALGVFEDSRFEYANRISGQMLKRFSLAAENPKRLKSLLTPSQIQGVTLENN